MQIRDDLKKIIIMMEFSMNIGVGGLSVLKEKKL